MLIRYDDQIFVLQRLGGISRYFVELMKFIGGTRDSSFQIAGPKWSRNQHLIEAKLGRAPARPLRRPLLLSAMNRLAQDPRTPDIVHHTFYKHNYLRYHSSGLRVVTIYDMIPELFPTMFKGRNPHAQKRGFVEAADLILCISQSTRTDLIRLYGKPHATIEVVPLGVDFDHFSTPVAPVVDQEPYMLYVGFRGRYKDFPVAAEALAKLIRKGHDLRMLCAGGGELTTEEGRLLAKLGVSSRVSQMALTDRELAAAYQHAACFVFPSRYEGFGLPTLEAMAAGCPAIIARTSSHPEAGGDAALYFGPQDADDLAARVAEVLTDLPLAHKLSELGRVRARRHSWSVVASHTLTAYRSALDSEPTSRGSDPT